MLKSLIVKHLLKSKLFKSINLETALLSSVTFTLLTFLNEFRHNTQWQTRMGKAPRISLVYKRKKKELVEEGNGWIIAEAKPMGHNLKTLTLCSVHKYGDASWKVDPF
ncbi:CLUMA_CG003622, isoform A [Clunio marinus]|uniref:CLUMA_CG003622, isoform A n=1 Tax=Clunio marinus TaxID=568069 RepID=A0A1J1HQS5_9DIPT|nr:CLUMA_CG003622, isoform A [Clunio marinus]